MLDYTMPRWLRYSPDDFVRDAPFQTRHNIRLISVGERKVPLITLELLAWADGLTAVSRSWLACKLKVKDRARLLLKRGHLGVIPAILASGGERIVKEGWFATKRSAMMDRIIYDSKHQGALPHRRIYTFPKVDPCIAIVFAFTDVAGDNGELVKEAGLTAGNSTTSRPGVFDNVQYGWH